VTGLENKPSFAIGGSPNEFTVTITNQSAASYTNIAPLVAVDRCSCSSGPVPLAPEGNLELRQPDGSWRAIFYVRIGGGMDYIGETQVAGITLAAGASATYTYRLGFKPSTQQQYTNGTARIEIDIVTVPNKRLARLIPATVFPIVVTTS